MTAGQPYVTSLLDLYALIIPSLGTNIDILGLNTQTLQTASLQLALCLLATREQTEKGAWKVLTAKFICQLWCFQIHQCYKNLCVLFTDK